MKMQKSLLSKIRVSIIGLTVLLTLSLYVTNGYTKISFINTPSTATHQINSPDKVNPINYVDSGSIIYRLSDSSRITQIALDTKVQMDITGTVNRVRVEQTFTNPSNEWVEGVYVFPLPEDSAVDHLTMHIGNQIIEGLIKEKIEARKIYQAAKKEGKKAALIEQQRPNIFTASVANIPPGESITIAIEYQQIVLIDNDQFSIRFPMVVKDRYVPGTEVSTPHNALGLSPNTHRVTDASEVTPPSDPDVARPVSIDIHLKAGFNPASIKSSHHLINTVDVNLHTKHISLSQTTEAEHDFELVWAPETTSQTELAIFTQKKDGDHYLMVMATPSKEKTFEPNQIPREVIIIIDSSGSMSGKSMKQAKKALIQAINRLKRTDRFNVIDFDDQFSPLFKAAMPAILANKSRATSFTLALSADGGTEPLEAIKYAFTSRKENAADYLRQIIFLTDGQVANEHEIIDTVRQYIKQDRLFTIGIGSAPNTYLMTKLADYGKGAFTYIGKVSEVAEKMTSLFAKLESPALTDIKVTLPSYINAEQANDVIPDLYRGETITAVFKLNKLPASLEITGKTSNGLFKKKINVSEASPASGISVLWGRRKIEKLTDHYQSLWDDVEKELGRIEITKLAIEHHLVSKFTSLVAIDVTPSRPGLEHLATKAVTKKSDLSMFTPKKVMHLAQTGTNASLLMLIGLLVILLASLLRRKKVLCSR
jgi:Ca-activated chloride channel family protein